MVRIVILAVVVAHSDRREKEDKQRTKAYRTEALLLAPLKRLSEGGQPLHASYRCMYSRHMYSSRCRYTKMTHRHLKETSGTEQSRERVISTYRQRDTGECARRDVCEYAYQRISGTLHPHPVCTGRQQIHGQVRNKRRKEETNSLPSPSLTSTTVAGGCGGISILPVTRKQRDPTYTPRGGAVPCRCTPPTGLSANARTDTYIGRQGYGFCIYAYNTRSKLGEEHFLEREGRSPSRKEERKKGRRKRDRRSHSPFQEAYVIESFDCRREPRVWTEDLVLYQSAQR